MRIVVYLRLFRRDLTLTQSGTGPGRGRRVCCWIHIVERLVIVVILPDPVCELGRIVMSSQRTKEAVTRLYRTGVLVGIASRT